MDDLCRNVHATVGTYYVGDAKTLACFHNCVAQSRPLHEADPLANGVSIALGVGRRSSKGVPNRWKKAVPFHRYTSPCGSD